MHYANGRVAKIGDLVRGKGYNVPYEIQGILVFANPDATTCNCQVAHVGPTSDFLFRKYTDKTGDHYTAAHVVASTEYGQLDGFVALDPKTGAVLPPEE